MLVKICVCTKNLWKICCGAPNIFTESSKMATKRSSDYQDPLDLLASISAAAAIGENKKKDAMRKRREREKKQKEDAEKQHKRRREKYLASLRHDRYMPPGLFAPIAEQVTEYQNEKKMRDIGKLLNRCTEIRKVLTLPGDRVKSDGDASGSAWFFKTHCGRGKNLMTIPPHAVIAEEWEVHFRGTHLFTIKPSTLKNAGFGLFFAQNIKQGQCVGLAHGKVKHPFEKTTSDCVWTSDSLGLIIDPGGTVSTRHAVFPIYLGIHLANDPGLSDVDERAVETPQYNVTVGPDFWVYTLSDVQKGQEVFMKYSTRKSGQRTDIHFGTDPSN